MKKETLFIVGVAAVLAYLYLRPKKQAAPKAAVVDMPPPQLEIPNQTGKPAVGIKPPITIDDLSKKNPSDIQMQVEIIKPQERPEIKEPIFIPATNVWPNIYDRGVGRSLPTKADDVYYASFSGQCSENIQTACRCVKEKDARYRLDVPKML